MAAVIRKERTAREKRGAGNARGWEGARGLRGRHRAEDSGEVVCD